MKFIFSFDCMIASGECNLVVCVRVCVRVHVHVCVCVQWLLLSCPADKEVFPGANKSLFVQFKKISEAAQAITDLVVLSSANKAKVPAGYRRLP